ncbi:pyridoxal phosphate-dependent aminotransferase [Marinithermus hydrothermalis]|uniref:Aminotransferase n=1 Tax=Marinithermus hydrothermalis (strain DSM 14884 / JCM 11576 / T1) TaxID=869210 RepID=F2NKN5_MARHT|nr:pyridoxal phosphate-dependent aminotransferase [Marinithermus hydrothermalis]AEB10798.1 Aspartate transaminase [Marinithermus hydrothermalis DSM 14884]
MKGLSERVTRLKPSATVAVNAKALELRRRGVDVIAMTAGEPDFDTPEHIKEAARRALAEGKTKYTPPAGIPELREALAEKFRRENGLEVSPEETMVTVGGKAALYNIFQALIDPGDEVILIAPYWVTYPAQIELAGGVPVVVPTAPEAGFIPDPDAVRAKVTPRTKALVVNSPNNPTGAVYPREVLEALARLAMERGFYLISDEIYEHLIYEGTHFSPGQLAPEHTITVNGAAKAFAMTGWRVGYAAGPKAVIQAAIKVQGQITTHATSIAQWATLEALTNPATQAFIQRARETFRARRELIVEGLNRLGFPTPKPQGAFYVMADVSRIDLDEVKAAERLLEAARVAVVPGTDFAAPRHVRFSYATSTENIQAALERLEALG